MELTQILRRKLFLRQIAETEISLNPLRYDTALIGDNNDQLHFLDLA